ncbi:hypothetical protein C2G38_2180084 [Gigaspora rosea]|uniref:Helicase ATP-binding domain-containing protein n=1 Tax=Gigaspora rosea TaxID=44941 RepID=A0A397VLR6_9GLOM|nr:hypothetical protein C2G38_2180084 [Gigaspora rosea]
MKGVMIWRGYDVSGVKSISSSLCKNTTITSLNLSSNIISDKGAKILADLLCKNTFLTHLNLNRIKLVLKTNLNYSQNLLSTNPNRIKYLYNNQSVFVREDSKFMKILPGHENLSNRSSIYQLLKIPDIQANFNEKIDFGTDYKFENPIISKSLPDSLSSLREYLQTNPVIEYKGTLSMPFILGFTCESEYEDESENELSDNSNSTSQEIINKLIKRGKLGSTIMISTEVYLNLLINQPCSKCKKIGISTYSYKIRTTGLSVKITLKCRICNTSIVHSNESPKVDFSKAIAGAGLVGGVNREELRTILALCGITRQSGQSQYFKKQEEFFEQLKILANESAQKALHNALTNQRSQNNFTLEVGFDFGWSFAHKPIDGYYVVEKPCTYQNKNNKTIIVSEGNYNHSSQQMEHEALKAIINNITPTLEKFQMLLEIGIDGDLNSNKTLGEQRIVYKICADLKHKAKLIRTKIAKNNKWRWLETPIMDFFNRCVYDAALQVKNHQTSPPTDEDFQNEAVNRIKLNYTDKKTDYPKSYSARHALAVLHNNYGLIEVLKITHQTGNFQEFSEQDLINIRKIYKQREEKCQVNINQIKQRNQKRAEKIIAQKNELRGFDYSQNLVPYGKHIKDQIKIHQFKLSFAYLIPNWTTLIKCEGCYSFPKRFPNGLCVLCGFYFKNDLLSQIPNELYHSNLSEALLDKSSSIKTNPLDTILPEVFGFQNYRDQQKESIKSFLFQKDTLSIMKKGSGKTLIYAVASILFEGLTVIFSPLKSLMEDQLELINMKIPTAVLYASSLQPPNIQSQIFGELSAKMIKILLIMGEKYIENIKLRSMLQNLSISYKIQFVIDEAHCIVGFEKFRNAWNQLGRLKSDFPNVLVLLLTATCSQIIAQKIMTSLNRITYEEQVIDSSIERQQQYLAEGTHKILEIVTKCENDYHCRQQLIYNNYHWPNDKEVLRILRIVDQLLKSRHSQESTLKYINRDIVVDVFITAKNKVFSSKGLSTLDEYGKKTKKVL